MFWAHVFPHHPHFSSFLYTFAIHQLLFFLFNVQSNRWIHEVASCHGLPDLIPTNETNVRKYRTLQKLLFFYFEVKVWHEFWEQLCRTSIVELSTWWLSGAPPPQRLIRTWASIKTLRPVATWWVLEASKVNMKLGSWVSWLGGDLSWRWVGWTKNKKKFNARGCEIRCLFFLE